MLTTNTGVASPIAVLQAEGYTEQGLRELFELRKKFNAHVYEGAKGPLRNPSRTSSAPGYCSRGTFGHAWSATICAAIRKSSEPGLKRCKRAPTRPESKGRNGRPAYW